MTKNPAPGTGRYMFKNVDVNHSYTLVKNPNFSDSLKGTAVDAGKVDQIDVTIVRDLSNQVTHVANGHGRLHDRHPAGRPPAGDQGEVRGPLPRVRRRTRRSTSS